MTERIINDAIKVLERYQNISHIINLNNARLKWNEKLIKNKISDSDINSTFNLFNLALNKIKSEELGTTNYAEEILYNLDRYLKIINGYDEGTIKNFSDKLININGVHLFSTLTELAIADHYKQNNYKVDYFFKYSLEYKDGTIKEKDFDLHLFGGKLDILIEIYMPTYTPDYDEVFPGDYEFDIEHLREHIYKKVEQKFDLKNSPQIQDFMYPLILAINTHYDAMLQTQLYIPLMINKLFQKIETLLKDIPKISGIMLVETDFTRKDSRLYLHKIIMNPIQVG